MFVVWIIFIPLFLLAVVLLTGHGSFLIAGYNTSSEEEKEKYDTHKLCRTVGGFILSVLISTAGLFLIPVNSRYSTPYIIFYLIFMILAIGFLLYYTNYRCLKKEYENNKNAGKSKSERVIILVTGMVTLPIILLVGITLYRAALPPVYIIRDDTLKISSFYGETIPLGEIKNLRMEETIPFKLSKKNGSDFGSILKGKFNAEGKAAHVYLDAAKPPFIFMESGEELYIINDVNREKTQMLYRQLKSSLKDEAK